jgi:hypothetical protein
MQGYSFERFLQGTQIHQDLVLDTTRRENRQFCAFAGGNDSMAIKSDRSVRYQILQIFICVVRIF